MNEIPEAQRNTRRRAVLIASFLLIAVFLSTLLIPAFMHNNTYEIIFTPTTTASADTDLFDTVPHRRMDDVVWLELEPGDSLVIRNTDTIVHELSGISIRPGETVLHTFHERGTFSGDCSVIDLTVFIEVLRR